MKILCPVDFSEPSREAVRAAIRLVRSSGGELTLLHAYQYPTTMYLRGGYPAPGLSRDIDEGIDKQLAEFRASLDAPGVKITLEKALGPAWDEIVRRADAGKYDLIVLSTHGRTGLQRALIGSVAEKVVRHASCDVLVVRGPASTKETP
jgi:nucleotide-binding universal stress UspA family protein